MRTIQTIIEKRTETRFFSDCRCGSVLNQYQHRTTEDLEVKLAELRDVDLLRKLIRTVDADDVAELLQAHNIDRQALRQLNTEQRWAVQDLLIATVSHRVCLNEAVKRGFVCSQYERCILCPHGQELTAREIAEYALSG
jgi:hypothetical protein